MFTADTSYHSWPQIARSWDIAASLDRWLFQSGPMNFPIARHPFAIHPTQTNKYLRSLAWMKAVMTYDKSLESLMKKYPVSLCWNASQLLLLWPSAQKLYGTQQLPSVVDGDRGGWALTCQAKLKITSNLSSFSALIYFMHHVFWPICPDAPIQKLLASWIRCVFGPKSHTGALFEKAQKEKESYKLLLGEQQFSKMWPVCGLVILQIVPASLLLPRNILQKNAILGSQIRQASNFPGVHGLPGSHPTFGFLPPGGPWCYVNDPLPVKLAI